MSGETRYFLDTNALVAFANGDEALGQLVLSADYIGTSVICKLEFLSWSGLPNEVREGFLNFLESIDLVGLDAADVDLHERIVAMRLNNPNIKLPDAIIMASAQKANSVLLTRDRQILNADLCSTQSF